MSSTGNPAGTVAPGARTVAQGALTLTSDGAAWLASAQSPKHTATVPVRNRRPTTPAVLPCGSAFDVVNAPAIFGRRMLDELWGEGPGSGPVAAYRGRMLLFATPGTAQRLPALLKWEEWGSDGGAGRSRAIPPLLCHGRGDAVTVPPAGTTAAPAPIPTPARWVVAPDTQRPWLPGPEVLLWAAVRAARAARISIFPHQDPGAKVYDVSRRR
ncbi:hypothetical protein [Streptomyces sp. NBC_00286]|uniref:hypothetical protein n=1 Tax=Streptomyces sp. NBC_00286 TaxID=2975701 RepID=UPI002E288427|nr:hypothetical protein [Streptomyces sp. NBC_00286]